MIMTMSSPIPPPMYMLSSYPIERNSNPLQTSRALDLAPHEIAQLRQSVAMAAPGEPSGLSRETALQVLAQLYDVTADRDRLRLELVDLGRI